MANEVTLPVPGYDSQRGVIAPAEGGFIIVQVRDGTVEIYGDSAGLRDLARRCLALSDSTAQPEAHVHLDPGVMPLSLESSPLMLARERG
ncbi:Imm32 family immunity protein [Micromonospora sp. KLBMP9576]|uniref:Imm32 family immunity protein n=1 Tax=Micromonospora sp. KLBMP9576 TaxID=3424769 RepID=UPI003D92989E